ncbi:hypothetical protein HN873_062954 [Arachis hypogaea]
MNDHKFTWVPSSGMLASGIEENGDDYRPYFEEGHVDIEECSGDSEEGIGASVGVSSEFQHINLSSSQENNSQKSTEKRKRDVNCQSRSTIVSTFLVPGASIREVMAKIQKMEMITSDDPDFHSRCYQLMMFKLAREMT